MALNAYGELSKILEKGNRAIVITELESGKKMVFDQDTILSGTLLPDLDNQIHEAAKTSIATGYLKFIEKDGHGSGPYLIEPYFPTPKMIIFGGGHIGLATYELAVKVGFDVTVIDDRFTFANKARFPLAERVICESFEKCFDQIDINPSTFVVICTRGHRHDHTCLSNVLKYNTAYTGMIGSKRRVKALREQLLAEGADKDKLAAVHAPIGLEIGAVTPQEIAVSIIAQVIACKRISPKKNEEGVPIRVKWADYDISVLEELVSGSERPLAMATIISTKGSVPRESGAKMLVWPDGRIKGTIGGGCSEGAIILKAVDIALKGGYTLEQVDMTGDVAEEEGMVCGGTMDVVIEYIS